MTAVRPRGLAVRSNIPLTALITVVSATAGLCVALAVSTVDLSGRAAAGALVLLVAATLAEAFPVPVLGVKAGATSIANIFIVAAAALYSWQTGVIVALATMLIVELGTRRPIVRALYNGSLYVCSAAAAGAALAAVEALTDAGAGFASIAASAAFYLTNIVLLAAVVSASQRVDPVGVLRGFARSTFTAFLTMATTTAVLVFLWESTPLAAALVAPPLVAIVLYQRRLHASLQRQRELDGMKDEFVAIVSHELRTPLASVYGGIETLQRDDLSPEQRTVLNDVIRSEGARLVRLVDEVLWVSRLDTPAQPSAKGRCDAGAVIEDVVNAAATTGTVGSVVHGLHPDLPEAAVADDALRRVLANLVENAVKYSPDGGDVVVSAETVDRMLEIAVTDEGIGIPEDKAEAIFEKFSRLDPQMGRGVGGTGLGLYICHQLVQQMGGTIHVSPNAAGRGSVFTIRLPIIEPGGN
ncbi:MAG TPA: HAMP domain-containing sensor histidine kinase [Gaiellaceae bacterium]|nr:HAMP domain-containing sensor histidine kinase [Gaiellaceae bacterium]